jgi:hypothetical protein
MMLFRFTNWPLRNRVEAAGVKGMTAQQAPDTEKTATHDAVASDGFLDEMGAGRLEAATRSKDRANSASVDEQEPSNPAGGDRRFVQRPHTKSIFCICERVHIR